MKRSWILIALCAGCATAPVEPTPAETSAVPAAGAPAQKAATAEAAPPDAAPVTDGDVTFGSVHGLQVIVKKNPTAEVVSGDLYVRGGVRNWGADNAGIEQLALSVATNGGTQSLDKSAFARKLAALGSQVAAQSGLEYATFASKSLTENWDATFALMADAFLHPALPPAEVELQRRIQLSALKHELENPDAKLRLLAHQQLFKGHPYANRAMGTLESVAQLKPEQLGAHLAKLRQTKRLLLVVVGNVDAAHVFAQVKAAFGQLPAGDYQPTEVPKVKREKPELVTTEQKLPTNYITGAFFGPGWKDAQLPAALVAMDVLNWREFEEVRTKRQLSYAPHAFYNALTALPVGGLYVTAVDPNVTMKVMLDEAHKMAATPVPEKELTGDKSVFLTGYLMQSETTDGQAERLGRAQLLGGDWKLFRMMPDRIKAVTAEDVQRFSKDYLHGLQTTVLGDPAKIDPALFKSL